VGEIEVSRSGTITVIRLRGEYDLADVEQLNRQLRTAFADEASSCLLDLSPATFIDSSIINAAVTWSREAQLSEREALAIFVAPDTAPSRVLDVIGLRNHLPIFSTEEAAMLALREGQRQRTERSLAWLTDAELAAKVERAQWASDAAAQELKDLQAEQHRRVGDAPEQPPGD
jgi:anti-anti-sigma factor